MRVLDDLSVGRAEYLSGLDVQLVTGSVESSDTVTEALQNQDVVIHLAAVSGVPVSIADPVGTVKTNVLGTLNLLEASRHGSVKRLVLASTCGALFAGDTIPVHEGLPPCPSSPYGASKLAGEALCQSFNVSYGLETVALRFSNVYGPFLSHKSTAAAVFLYAARDGTPLNIYGDGSQSRDFVYVGDIVEAIVKASEASQASGEFFHIGTGREISVLELAETVKKVTGLIDLPVKFQEERPGDVARSLTLVDKARDVLGFSARYTLADGLKETWDWVLNSPTVGVR